MAPTRRIARRIAAVGHSVAIVDVGADTITLINASSLQVAGRLAAG
jgi:hypothetical protein